MARWGLRSCVGSPSTCIWAPTLQALGCAVPVWFRPFQLQWCLLIRNMHLWDPKCTWTASSLQLAIGRPDPAQGLNRPLCCSPAFLPSRHALKVLHCFIQGISSSHNKINSPLKCPDKGFPFHIQQLKVNFLYQRWCLGSWGFSLFVCGLFSFFFLWGGVWGLLGWFFFFLLGLGFFLLVLFGDLLFMVFFLVSLVFFKR